MKYLQRKKHLCRLKKSRGNTVQKEISLKKSYEKGNGSELFMDKSNMYIKPSVVTAANTVDENGAQSASDTADDNSNVNMASA